MPQFDTTPIPYVEIGTQAAAVRTAIDAAQLSAANSFGGLQKLAIPGPFATDAEASTGGVPDDNLYYRSDGTVRAASHISLDLAFALDKTLTARTGPTPTFTRASGATYVGSDGLIHGIDTSTTSVTFGTGSKTVTLSAPLGQDQMWRVGDAVEIVNSAGALMFGTVTSYTASTQDLVCDITSSTGTGPFTTWRIGYRGARFDHDPATGASKGLLIEEPRINYLIHSQDFQNWNSNINVVSRSKELSIADPSGGFTSNRIVANTSWSVYRDQVANGAVPNGVHSVSIFARAVTGGFNILTLTGSSVNVRVNLDLGTVLQSSGTTGTALVTPFGPIGADGFRWYRISYVPVDTTSEALYMESAAFTGTRDICLVWGAQFEVGAFATSYIPTIPAEAARSADVCSIIGGDFSSFYNQSEGTAITKVTNASGVGTTTQYPFSFSGASASELLITFRTTPAKDCRFASWAANVDTLADSANAGTLSDMTTDIIGFAIKLNDFAGSLDGNLITDTTVSLPTVDRMFIGSRVDGTRHWGGHIARIQYFRKRLSNAKLQTLTTP
jgi:hypothetical protein